MTIRVLLADDHQILRAGLAAMLGEEPDIEVVGQAGDGQEAVELARSLLPDVVIMDITMPKLSGIDATRMMAADLPKIRVIGLSMYDREDMAAAMLQAGAVGYVSKDGSTETLLNAVRSVTDNWQPS